MPGANYMGGKRNAVRVKLKDTTGRTQKGFFHRQRLEMLAKGLNPNKSCDRGVPAMNEISEITLSHAKNHTAMKKRANHTVRNQVCHPAQSYSIRKYDIDTQCRDGSTCDTSQTTQCATSLRSLCDRILATPDLAGLQRNETLWNQRNLMEAAYSKEGNVTSPVSLSLSPSTPSNCTPQPWSSADGLDEHTMKDTDSTYLNNQASIPLDRGKSPRTSISRYRTSRNSLPSYRTPSTGSEGWSPEIATKLSSSLLSDLIEEKATSTERYMRFRNDCGKSGAQSTSLIESPATPQQSAGGKIAMPGRDSGNTFVRLRSLSMDTSPFSRSETPEASPSAKGLHRGTSVSKQPIPLPGCIFDYEDPWDAIGIIMGLPRYELRSTTLEEELTTLGANGNPLGIVASDDGFRLRADILTESYSYSIGSIRFSPQEFNDGQESQISDGIWPDDLEGQSCGEAVPLIRTRRSSGSLLPADDGSMHEDSSIDYVTLGFYEDGVASSLDQALSGASVSSTQEAQLEPSNPCAEDNITVFTIQKYSPLLVQSIGPLTDGVVTNNDGLRYTEAESDRETSYVLSPSHPACSPNPQPIDDDYGLNLFSDESDVESP